MNILNKEMIGINIANPTNMTTQRVVMDFNQKVRVDTIVDGETTFSAEPTEEDIKLAKKCLFQEMERNIFMLETYRPA